MVLETYQRSVGEVCSGKQSDMYKPNPGRRVSFAASVENVVGTEIGVRKGAGHRSSWVQSHQKRTQNDHIYHKLSHFIKSKNQRPAQFPGNDKLKRDLVFENKSLTCNKQQNPEEQTKQKVTSADKVVEMVMAAKDDAAKETQKETVPSPLVETAKANKDKTFSGEVHCVAPPTVESLAMPPDHWWLGGCRKESVDIFPGPCLSGLPQTSAFPSLTGIDAALKKWLCVH